MQGREDDAAVSTCCSCRAAIRANGDRCARREAAASTASTAGYRGSVGGTAAASAVVPSTAATTGCPAPRVPGGPSLPTVSARGTPKTASTASTSADPEEPRVARLTVRKSTCASGSGSAPCTTPQIVERVGGRRRRRLTGAPDAASIPAHHAARVGSTTKRASATATTSYNKDSRPILHGAPTTAAPTIGTERPTPAACRNLEVKRLARAHGDRVRHDGTMAATAGRRSAGATTASASHGHCVCPGT